MDLGAHSTIFIIAQIVGGIAFVFGLYGYAQHCERRVRIFMGIQGIIAALHFLLLGRLNGSFSAGLSGIRNFLSMYGKLKILTWPLIVFYVAFGIYGFEKWFDILPIMASTLSTYNYFYLKDKLFRINLILVSSLWCAHNVCAHSWALSVMELLLVIIGIKTYLKLFHHKDKKTL